MYSQVSAGVPRGEADSRYQSISGALFLQVDNKAIATGHSFYAIGTYEIATPNTLEIMVGAAMEIG